MGGETTLGPDVRSFETGDGDFRGDNAGQNTGLLVGVRPLPVITEAGREGCIDALEIASRGQASGQRAIGPAPM